MIEIIKERRTPSNAERFGNAFSGLGQSLGQEIPEYFQKLKEKKLEEAKINKENESIKALIGREVAGIRDPKMRQELLAAALKGEESERTFGHEKELQGLKFGHEKGLKELESSAKTAEKMEKLTGEAREKIAPLQAGLQTIQQMRRLGGTGKLGRGSAARGFFGGETAKTRAEYTQLGKSLISLASNIPIRNQKEFETLAHDLYDASLPDDAREGILNAMERIISQSMQQYSGSEGTSQQMPSKIMNMPKEKPPLSSFLRKK